jgi:hypothetical protein
MFVLAYFGEMITLFWQPSSRAFERKKNISPKIIPTKLLDMILCIFLRFGEY